jgi:hypothetical protein
MHAGYRGEVQALGSIATPLDWESERRTFHFAAIVDAPAPCLARKPKTFRLSKFTF